MNISESLFVRNNIVAHLDCYCAMFFLNKSTSTIRTFLTHNSLLKYKLLNQTKQFPNIIAFLVIPFPYSST